MHFPHKKIYILKIFKLSLTLVSISIIKNSIIKLKGLFLTDFQVIIKMLKMLYYIILKIVIFLETSFELSSAKNKRKHVLDKDKLSEKIVHCCNFKLRLGIVTNYTASDFQKHFFVITFFQIYLL